MLIHMSKSNTEDHFVAGGFGLGFIARSGQFVSIVDLQGAQAGDFVAINHHNLKEGISSVRTLSLIHI